MGRDADRQGAVSTTRTRSGAGGNSNQLAQAYIDIPLKKPLHPNPAHIAPVKTSSRPWTTLLGGLGEEGTLQLPN